LKNAHVEEAASQEKSRHQGNEKLDRGEQERSTEERQDFRLRLGVHRICYRAGQRYRARPRYRAGPVKINTSGLEHLRGLPKLNTLILDTTPVTDAGLACLAELSGLVSLSLTGCEQVTDAGVAHCKGLIRLRRLELGNTQVTDAGLAYIEGLTDLEELDLHGTLITDAGLVHLRRLAKLRALHLGYARLTDAGLAHLEGLTDLTTLNLENTEVSRPGVEGLRRYLPRVTVVYGPETAPVCAG
jgi:Leucine-rich repeat (LRR) protein